jgi:hypothetical protein
MISCNQTLLRTGVIVIEEGRLPRVVRWPREPKRYITVYQLDSTNRSWSESIWQRNLQLQMSKVGALRTELAFACVMGGEYVCFLSMTQESWTGDDQAWLDKTTKAMRETQMSFGSSYLQLQSKLQEENRLYVTLSNIMKTKHDTAKNSINNVRG